MSGIGSVTQTKSAAPLTKAQEAAEAKKKDLDKAASGFETMLVKQMLATSKVAGKGEYSDMGVDALANAVTDGGGLGLKAAIEKAVGQHDHPAPPPTPKK